ncbi:hypothetical protein ACFQ1S_19300, partial [Kibdelosporangium lantanae]
LGAGTTQVSWSRAVRARGRPTIVSEKDPPVRARVDRHRHHGRDVQVVSTPGRMATVDLRRAFLAAVSASS